MVPRRPLGSTGLSVSELGFGCSSFWAKPAYPEAKATSLVEKAIESGVNLFDTAPSYASGGAEKRLGTILHHLNAKDIVVCSKVGRQFDSRGRSVQPWSPRHIKESVYASLDRLRLDKIQVLHLHGPEIKDLSRDVVCALSDLRKEGVVGFVGINSFKDDVIRHGLRQGCFDSFMIEYNLLKKKNAFLIDEISKTGAGVIVATPLAQNLFRKPADWFPFSWKTAWEFARAMKNHRSEFRGAQRYQFLNKTDLNGSQIALSFVLRNKNVSAAIFGTTSETHLYENIGAADVTLSANLLSRIMSIKDA